jgi:ribosomal RNA assembly protein
MEQILIPNARVRALKEALPTIEKRITCKIVIENRNEVRIEGDSYSEYVARNIVQAIARGFKLSTALKLLNDNYFFDSIDIGDIASNKLKKKRMVSRIIGTDGKAKLYMEEVSGASVEIYGDTISLIGSIDEIRIAKSGINILLDGGKHSTAYAVMEKERRKLKSM